MQSPIIRKADVHFQLDLHPSRLENVPRGVADELNRLIMRYSEDLDGVVLSISEPNTGSHKASIHPYFPYFTVKATASVVLFNPKPGDFLVGKVNQTGADYIALLVLGVFSVSIGVQNMRAEFKRDDQALCWQSTKRDSHKITVDSMVRFQVASVSDQGGFFSIVGSLQDPCTGEVRHAHKAMLKQQRKSKKSGKTEDDTQGKVHKAKKRMRPVANGESAEVTPTSAQDHPTPNKRKKKKIKSGQHETGEQFGNGTSHSNRTQPDTKPSTTAATAAAATATDTNTTPATSAKKRKRTKEAEQKLPVGQHKPAPRSGPIAGSIDGVQGSGSKKKKSKSKSQASHDTTPGHVDNGGGLEQAQPALKVSGVAGLGPSRAVNDATALKARQEGQANGDAMPVSEGKKKKSKARSKELHAPISREEAGATPKNVGGGAAVGQGSVNPPSEKSKKKKTKVGNGV